ncbi:hypothetical protein SZ55_0694 [Pseudomonas sp. FeS53a]|nr:hypothetical protein SZ55_0694 [Pseudomonas sp. FeS53a]
MEKRPRTIREARAACAPGPAQSVAPSRLAGTTALGVTP